MVTAMTARHERRFRRLLWAYPGDYRRRHGAEIVTTLLEMAEAEPGRRSIGPALHLVACGLRQRFRLPRRPLPVLAALLAAVAAGALGAVAGTWFGWQTAAAVPSTADAGALASAAAGLPWPSVDPWTTAMNGPGVNTTISGTGTYDPERVRTALTAAGWRITTFTESDEEIVVDLHTTPVTTIPARALQFTATRDGLSLTGGTDTVVRDGATFLALDITADPNGAVRPLTIAGLVLGLFSGWLVAAALAHRVRRLRWVAPAIALGAAAVPAFVAYCETYQVMVYDTHAPDEYITYSPSDRIPMTLTLISAVVAVAATAAGIGRRREPDSPESALLEGAG